MKFIAKRLNLIGILLLAGFTTAAAALYFDLPARLQKPAAAKVTAGDDCCPGHLKPATAKVAAAKVAAKTVENCDDCPMPAGAACQEACDHAAGGAHEACGVKKDACCPSEAAAEFALPAGHPPVPGFNAPMVCPATGASDGHAAH